MEIVFEAKRSLDVTEREISSCEAEINLKKATCYRGRLFPKGMGIPLRRSNFALRLLFAKNQANVVACFGFCTTP